MKYIKTYEGFFDNLFGSKKPFNDADIVNRVKETLLDLSDNGYTIEVEREDEEGLLNDVTPFIIITIQKDATGLSDVNLGHFDLLSRVFNLTDIKNPLQFTISYLKDEVGLRLHDIVFREDKWTHTGNRGTKKQIRYTRLSQIKESDRTHSVEITFK